MASSRDLRVQIAGDATKLLSAVDAAERKLGQFATSSTATSDKVTLSNRRMDDSFLATARVHEAATAKIVAGNKHVAESSVATGGALGAIHKHALAGGLAVAGLFGGYSAAKSAVNDTIQLGKATAFLSSTTGTSVKQSSELAAVMQSMGIESAGTAMSIKALSKQTELQIAGTSKSATAFDKLGISQAEASAHSHDMVGLLELVANRLQGVQGGTQKTTILTALFGKSYQNINPLIRDGGKALAENIALADKYGVTLNARTLPKILEMAKAEREHKLAMLGLKVAFTDIAGKPMIEFEHRLASILNDIRGGNWADLTKQTQALGDGLAKTIEAVTPKLADAFAKAGPKIVLGLVHGFTQASVGGELLIGALLVKKFGLLSAFTSAGSTAAKAFALKFGIGAEAAAAAEGAAAGKTFGVAFDAAAAEGIAAGAAEGGVIMGAIVAAAPLLAAALGLAIGSKIAGGLTGGGLSTGPGDILTPYQQQKGIGAHGKGAGFLSADSKYIAGRVDQGQDFTTNAGGPIVAPGAGKVLAVKSDPKGFGPDYPVVHFTTGTFAGKDVYIGHTHAALHAGDTFAAGRILSYTGNGRDVGNATVPGWAEIGFASALGSGNMSAGKAIHPYFADTSNIFAQAVSGLGLDGVGPSGPSGGRHGAALDTGSSGGFRTVGASMYGGPSDPSSG
ncbi:MAG: phage tail tape measure protein, partial [Actinomycetota bacterium]|nr:phage tail tape measure protein [Actinomycetota bacterium]